MTRRFVFVNRFFFPDSSATSQILSDLAFALAERGLNIHVIASRQQRAGASSALPAEETVRNVMIHRITAPDFRRFGLVGRALEYLAFYFGAVRMLWRTLRQGDVAIAKTDPPMISVVAAVIVQLRNATLVNWIQDLYPEVAMRLSVPFVTGPVASILTRLRNTALNSATVNVAIGERMADFISNLGVSRDSIRVIPNWTDDETIVPVPAPENPLRARLGLRDVFVFGYSGNLGRAHEFETVLGAADLLRGETGVVFLFFAAGHQVDALKDRVDALGLGTLFLFLPPQPRSDLSYSLSLPDLHWLSLRPDLEGLIVPSKFYGIAAAGRPVICITADDGEVAALVKANGCGAAINPGKSAELAELIRRLRVDAAGREEMGENARRLIDERLSKRRSIDNWELLLRSLVTSAA